MKPSLLSIFVLFLCLTCSSPISAAAKFNTHPVVSYQQDFFTTKKRQKQGFVKRAWQTIFPKKQLRQKPFSRKAKFSFGGWALIAISLSAITIFIHNFWLLGLITWAATWVLGIIGLFKDESKAMAIIALSSALVLPMIIMLLFSLNCCGT